MFSPLSDLFCVIPACYRPMTVMLIDDDPDFLNQLSHQISEHFPVITFTDPDKAIDYFNQHNASLVKKWLSEDISNKSRIIQEARQEIYNDDRFKEILVSAIDYEMPNKNGFDVMQTMGEPILSEMSFHSYILLTGKRFSDFDEKLTTLSVGKNFISKWDPNRVDQLLDSIRKKTAHAFQWMSYKVARELSKDPTDKTTLLFDGNFLPIFNKYIQDHKIFEMYLYDKQGSYLFLDENAKLSWFFVRSDIGMLNTVKLAKQFKAPSWVIDEINSKEKLLSLYEKEDFERIKNIVWEDYLLPATKFESDDSYMKFFNLEQHSNYYYAFTDNFNGHDIDQKKIISYRNYLNAND